MLAKDCFGSHREKTVIPGHHGNNNNSFLMLAVFLVIITFLMGAIVEVLAADRHILSSVLVICVHDTAVGRLAVLCVQGLHKDDPDIL